jgi:hypothetical protein
VVESCKQTFAVADNTAAVVAGCGCLCMEFGEAGHGAPVEVEVGFVVVVVEPGCTALVRVVPSVAVAQAERAEAVVVLRSVAV